MAQARLIGLFILVTLICICLFTAVIYHAHVRAYNQQDLNYLQLYVEKVDALSKQGQDPKQVPLPYPVIENNTYHIIHIDKKGKRNYWLKSPSLHRKIKQHFPFGDVLASQSITGHFESTGSHLHWIKLPLNHPPADLIFIHPDSNHWQDFYKTFGTPVLILSLFLIWLAVWSAIILSNLFKRVQSKNDLLQSQAIEICNARDEAYEAAKAKSRFLANISHELRTPLTAILGFSENMLDTDDTCSSQKAPLQTIIRNGNHLLHIINDLLDISKIEEDQLQIERIDFSPVQLLQDVELLMRQQAEDKGLGLKVNYAWPLPVTIKNDPFRIKQVLINLCSNAVKFTEQGYIHLNIRCQRAKDQLLVEVIDTGIGIESTHQEIIFQPFHQADVSTTRQFGGTGLGLSLTKHLVGLMGGTIELSSEKGKGSRFMICLPTGSLSDIEFISSLDKHLIPSTGEEAPEATMLKGHVLLADDAPDNRILITALLTKLGLDVIAVENGQLALDMIAEKDFDLVILDIQMPVIDGMETLKRLQQQGFDKPVIALTANTLKEERELYEQAGFTSYIAKPVRFRTLNTILSQYLESNE
ncbi:MAG: ATP-binding protein [Gammaproteobacteria bacterium]|nr:ATP-binding protein [Gammaproteobacteria bacterium]